MPQCQQFLQQNIKFSAELLKWILKPSWKITKGKDREKYFTTKSFFEEAIILSKY